MSKHLFLDHINNNLASIRKEALYKEERIITSPQQAVITVESKGTSSEETHPVINFCANNYLGLANHPALIEAGKAALDHYGFGMSSVRFICGTQSPHKLLEKCISDFLGMEDTILYSSCFDANGGLFEPLLDENDAVISDELNHASIIDGIRLCKAKRFRYKNNDMADLENQLKKADENHARFKMIVTDGVFSMEGTFANLNAICDLADRYQAIVMVDDSHAVGFIGEKGRGTHEHCNVMGRVDIMTGTLGKALGGASGGYTSGPKEIIDWLRQRSRPYLFSNTLAPTIAATSLKVFELLKDGDALRAKLRENTHYFRSGLEKLGFDLLPGEHPIIPIMLGDANVAKKMSQRLLAEGIYVIGFSYPVVPLGKARIRTQMSAAHEREHIDRALMAFKRVGIELGIL